MSSLKQFRRTIRRPFETAAFRLGTLLVPLLPRPVLVGMMKLTGTMTFYLAKRERSYGMANLNIVFGDTKTDAEKRAILKKSFKSFANTMADLFWFSVNTEKRVRKYQTFVPAISPYFKDKAQIIITAHTGNWELIGLESGLRGLNVGSIAATTKNAVVDRHLINLRQRTGQTIIPQKGAMRTLISRFRNGGKAAFVLDQNTSEAEGGIWVDFLGMPTPVSSAPAHLAYRTGTEIIFAFSHPVGGGKYEARIGEVIQPPPYEKSQDQEAVVAELTQQIVDVVGQQILDHPEHWLWSYKHWRTVAPGDDPAKYPKYD